ncbi:hypothetical protein FPRO05_00887 [Fusarium proliferatum]|uniref:Uncharacterized protein n=1 Tax=Gibberella intermedia TaxID=948311 RepID=A0A365NNW2_GIBIN|nr:hypothetical protein FPRO05_00887 [Fusarium proliferatum]
MTDLYFWYSALLTALTVTLVWWRNKKQYDPKPYSTQDSQHHHQELPSDYNDIEPLEDFDLDNAEPVQTRPWKPKYHLTMGLEKCTFSDILPIDKTLEERLALRRKIVTEHSDMVIASDPCSEAAVKEFYIWMVRTYLPRRYPSLYHSKGDTLLGPASTKLPLDPPNDVKAVLSLLAENMDTELFFLQRQGDSYVARALIDCYPFSFNPSLKLNKTLAEIHGPVPGYKEKLERPMNRYFTSLPKGKAVKRHNWNISIGRDLFAPRENPLTVLPFWLMDRIKTVLDWLGIEVLTMKGADLDPEEMNLQLRTLLEALATGCSYLQQCRVGVRAVFMIVLTLMLDCHAEPDFYHCQQARKRDVWLCHCPWSMCSAKQDNRSCQWFSVNTENVPIKPRPARSLSFSFLFLLPTDLRSSLSSSNFFTTSIHSSLLHQHQPTLTFVFTNSPSAINHTNNCCQQRQTHTQPQSPTKTTTTTPHQQLNMAFLELTAPRSPTPEPASTISSEDNKLVALTPPSHAFAETTNTTSAEVSVDNTDKVSLQSPIKDHELKEPKAFDQMIAHINAMRAKVQALESENTELKAQVEYEKSFKEHFSKNLDEANNNLHSAEREAAIKFQTLESENTELKAQVEHEKSSKEQFSNNLETANRNWRFAESESAAKVQALESENNEIKAQLENEKSFKEHYSRSLDEANRNWHSAEFEAAAKEAELGRVRERLSLVEAQVTEQAELHAVKEQNTELQARYRYQFYLTTHHHVQTLKHMMHDWKAQVVQKIDEEYEKNQEKENDSAAVVDDEYERLKALVEGHDYIITNIKKGNEKFATLIKDLRESEDPTLTSDLAADRFEAFLSEREKMVAQLEQEKEEFVEMVNEN